MIENYSCVQLLTDKFREAGAGFGAIGYIIERYDNGDYEVEFSKPDGTTYALITANAEELAVADQFLASATIALVQ